MATIINSSGLTLRNIIFSARYTAPTYKALVISDSPIAYWPMDDASNTVGGSNGSFADVMSNPQPAINSGPVVFGANSILAPLLESPYYSGSYFSDFSPPSTPNKFTFLSTDTITIEAWFSMVDGQPVGDIVSFNANQGFRISVDPSTNNISIIYNNSLVTSIIATNDTYQYIVSVIGPNGCKVYLNGVLKYSNSNGWTGTTGVNCSIGGQSGTSSSEYITGFISNVAIYKKELTLTQILNHFNVGGGNDYLTYLQAQTPVALWMLNDSNTTAIDYGPSGSYNGTYFGPSYGQNHAPARNLYPSVQLNGNSYIKAGYTTTTNPLTFSYGIWFSSNTSCMIMGFQDAVSAGSETNWDRCLYISSDGQLGFGTINGSTVTTISGGPDVRNSDDWHYAVVTFSDNGNGTCTGMLYLDGYPIAQDSTMQTPSSYSITGSGNYYLTIGYNHAGSTWHLVDTGWATIPDYYQGFLTSCSYYDRVLTATEILDIFNTGSISTGWESLYLTFRSGANDASSFNNIPNIVGSPTFGYSGPTSSTYACLFGEGDYISYSPTVALTPVFDFTVDFYVNFTSLPSSSQLCTWWNQTPANGLNLYYDGGIYTKNVIVLSDTNYNYITYGWTPTVGQWYHIQFERRNSIVYLFIDGTLVQASTCSAVFSDHTVTIGGRGDLLTSGSMLGYISNLKFTNGQSLITPTGPVSDLVTLLHFDNNLNDSSVYNVSWAPNTGSPTFSISSPFDGVNYSLVTSQGNWITAGSNTLFEFAENNFTVEMWVNFSVLPNSSQLAMFFEQNVAHGLGWYFDGGVYNPANSLVVSDNTANYIVYGWTPTLNVWYSVAVVRDVNNNLLRLFINGTQVATGAVSPTLDFVIGETTVGGHPGLPTRGALIGNITEVKITNGEALYSSTYQPYSNVDPQWLDVTALMHFLGTAGTETFFDNSKTVLTGSAGTGNFVATTGVVLSSAQAKFGGTSLVFPGDSNQYLQLNGGDWFNFGLNDFTIEMFIYIAGNSPSHAGGERAYLLVNRNNYSAGYDDVYILLQGNGGTTGNGIEGGYGNFDSTGYVIVDNPSTVVSQNTWHHIAMVRASNVLTLYVDGISQGNVSVTTRTFGTPSVPVMLGGANNNPYDAPFNGNIDEFRVTNGFARYTGNFTPPSMPFASW